MIDEQKYNLLIKMRFLNYPTHIVTSNSVRAKYYYLKDKHKLPNKYASGLGLLYDWADGKLFNLKTGEFVITNPTKAGKPNLKKINGQAIYNLTLRDYEKKKISDTLKHFYNKNLRKHIDKLKRIFENQHEKIHIHITYFTRRNELEDLDNHSLLYQKILFDAMQKTRIITDGRKKIKVANEFGFLENDNVDIIESFSIRYKKLKDDSNLTNYMMIKIYSVKQFESNLPPTGWIINKAIQLTEYEMMDKGLPENDIELYKQIYDKYFNFLTD